LPEIDAAWRQRAGQAPAPLAGDLPDPERHRLPRLPPHRRHNATRRLKRAGRRDREMPRRHLLLLAKPPRHLLA